MAMEGTHVRFARDLARRLGVVDEKAYYSGAVYPDSRYATGVSRDATHHGAACPQDPFATGLSDFQKGWATHAYYDEAAKLVRRQRVLDLIPEELQRDDWAFATALKLVEDMESVRALGGDLPLIREVRASERPFGEDPDVMERYYADLRAAYATSCESVSDYRAFSLKIGISPERADVMIAIATALSADPAIVAGIHAIYGYVLLMVRE